jgi:hypothetical protein
MATVALYLFTQQGSSYCDESKAEIKPPATGGDFAYYTTFTATATGPFDSGISSMTSNDPSYTSNYNSVLHRTDTRSYTTAHRENTGFEVDTPTELPSLTNN